MPVCHAQGACMSLSYQRTQLVTVSPTGVRGAFRAVLPLLRKCCRVLIKLTASQHPHCSSYCLITIAIAYCFSCFCHDKTLVVTIVSFSPKVPDWS